MRFARSMKGAAVALGAALVLAGCSGSPAEDPAADPTARGEKLTLGSISDVASWDPAQAGTGNQLQPYQAPYDTLILREPDGTLSPMLATEWTYNDDRTELTLDLRTDVTFSDGTPFDAEAVKANLEHFAATNGPQSAQLTTFETVDVVDDDTVTIILSGPDSAFEYYLSQAAGLIASPAAIADGSLTDGPVGTGPYVYEASSSVAGSQYAFSAREDYWNPGLQRFDTVELRYLQDETARLNALVSGQVDATLINAQSTTQAEGADKTLVDYQLNWYGLLLMDREGALTPALADVRVRQAINFAFDREAILQQLQQGYGDVTVQPFGPDSDAYDDSLESTYEYDPEKARQLLADAGYPDGFELTAPVPSGFETDWALIGQQLADIGITVNTQSVPFPQFRPDVAAQKYPVAVFSLQQGLPAVQITNQMSTTAFWNPFETTTPEFQELIDSVRAGGDGSAEAAQEVNRYVVENAWFAPLYRPDELYFIDGSRITAVAQIQQAVPSIYNYSPVQ